MGGEIEGIKNCQKLAEKEGIIEFEPIMQRKQRKQNELLDS